MGYFGFLVWNKARAVSCGHSLGVTCYILPKNDKSIKNPV